MRRNDNHSITEFNIPDTTAIEDKILATIIGDPTNIDGIIRIVKSEMFSQEPARYLWDLIYDMYYKHDEINLVNLTAKSDVNYVTERIIPAMNEYMGINGLVNLAMTFVDTYIKRQAYFKAVEILRDVNDMTKQSEDITAHFNTFSENVYQGLEDKSCESAEEIIVQMIDKLESGIVTKIPTQFPTLDSLTNGGLGGGDLAIIAARPSVGKSQIAMQICQKASMKGEQVLCFSLEMSKEQLVRRLLLSTGLLSPYELNSCRVNWANFNHAVSQVINKNLIINDRARTIEEICHKIILEHQAGRCKMAMIDYLGLIQLGMYSRDNLATQLGKITTRLKGLAKECNIPVILLCQLNRESVAQGRSPQLHDLRDSGSIEQDADIVLMLERPKENGVTLENTIDLWVRKNRDGKCTFDTPIRLQGNRYYSDFREVIKEGEQTYELIEKKEHYGNQDNL